MTKKTTLSPELLKKAVALHQQGCFAHARQLYQQILLLQPDHFDAMHFLGVIAKQSGQPAEAITLINHAIATLDGRFNTSHASAFCNLGTAYQDCQQPELALKSYLQAIELKPDYAIAHNNLGNALKMLGRIEDAMQSYQNALAASPNYAEAYFNAGIVLLDNQKFEAALRCFDRAIEIKPDYIDAWFASANTYQSLRMNEEAIRNFDHAIALKPNYAKAYFNRGISFNRLAQYDNAIQSFELAIHHQPHYANAFACLANTLKLAGKIPEAIAAYRRASEMGADPDQIRFALAALGVSSAPAAPPVDYVKDLFNQYADRFNTHLVDVLNYDVPQLLASLTDKYAQGNQLITLDLGCGTGLCGQYLRARSTSLTGVDLAQKMLDKAAQLNLYDELICAELNEFLRAYSKTADLIIAADVLVYLGDLLPLFSAIARVLSAGGYFCFSVEESEANQHPYILQISSRYAHSEQYLRNLAAQCGLNVMEMNQHTGRLENQQRNKALIVLLQKVAPEAQC